MGKEIILLNFSGFTNIYPFQLDFAYVYVRTFINGVIFESKGSLNKISQTNQIWQTYLFSLSVILFDFFNPFSESDFMSYGDANADWLGVPEFKVEKRSFVSFKCFTVVLFKTGRRSDNFLGNKKLPLRC